MRKVLLAFILILAIGCTPSEETVDLQPFIGGDQGLEVDFLDLRKEVFDGGSDPFDVIVRLTNRGEMDVEEEAAVVKISGIRAQSFGKSDNELSQNPQDDVLGLQADSEGNVILGAPIFVEFLGLNHMGTIVGATLQFPLRADVCYEYKTMAVSKICVRKDLISPEAEGICDIAEKKPVYNSGAPVHVQNLRESSQGRDKIRFTFDIRHVGTGIIFEQTSQCEIDRKKNKVFVRVDTHIPGLSCTGLKTASGTSVEGTATLFDGIKTIQCTQTISKRSDYEQEIDIIISYKYEDSKTAELIVKHAGN